GELHEVAEVLDARVAATLVEVAHERRAIRRCEHRAVAADDDVMGRIARVLGEFPGGRALYDAATHAAGIAHTLALHVGTGLLPDLQRLRIVAEIDADLLQDGVGVVLEQREPLLAQDFVVGNLAGDERDEGLAARGARRDFGVAATGAARARRRAGLGLLVHDIHLSDYTRRGRAQCPLWPRRACPNWSNCGMHFSACATCGRRSLGRGRYRQFDEARAVAGVEHALRGLAVAGRTSEEDVVHVGLRVAVVERKPARLDLHHNAVPGQEHVVHVRQREAV